jgi:sigma-B regulation protein RsbU (phosphoserine phosphatase)
MGLDPAQPDGESHAVDESGFAWPLAFMRHEQFKKGEYLFKAGDPAERVFLIARGLIRLCELDRVMKPGQVLGEIGIFSPKRSRSASALAEEDVDTYTMGREEVCRLMSRDAALATSLIEVMLKRMLGQLETEIEARERIHAELRVARNIQHSMLPREFPPFPGRNDFEIHATMEPASEVGGDFYDFFLIRDDRLCVLVGDVSGKGIPAALLMAVSKTLLRSEAMQGHPPGQILARVNQALCAGNPECMFLTVFCLILNTRTGEAEYSSGGHNPPLLRSRDGVVSFIGTEPGLLIGYDEDFRWESTALKFNPGDTVFLYTDGITEAENANQDPYSDDRFRKLISALPGSDLKQVLDGVRQDIARHAQGQAQSDDITLLALKYNGPSR